MSFNTLLGLYYRQEPEKDDSGPLCRGGHLQKEERKNLSSLERGLGSYVCPLLVYITLSREKVRPKSLLDTRTDKDFSRVFGLIPTLNHKHF